MISFFFSFFCCFALKPFKEKEHRNKFHVVMKRNKAKNNKLSCRVTQRCSRSYCMFCLAVISNVTFFGKTYTNDNPLFVRKLKDS